MKKWIVTGLIVVALALLAWSVQWWLPRLLAFVDANGDRIQSITDGIQLVLWLAVAAAAVIGLWRNTHRPAQADRSPLPKPTPEIATAEGNSAAATGGSIAVVGPVNAPIYQNPTFTASVAEVEAARVSDAEQRYLRRLVQSCNVLPLASLGGDEGTGQEVTLDRVDIELNTQSSVPKRRASADG